MQPKLAPMTLRDLSGTIDAVIRHFGLGEKSVRRSSAYHDYVAMEFAMFVDPRTTEILERRFRALCDRHGWECLTITTGNGNAVFVTMHEKNMITSSDQRMPLGDETPSWDKVRV